MAFDTEQQTSDDRRQPRQKDRKRRTGRKVLLGFVAFFLVVAAAAGLFAFNLAQSFDSKAQKIDNAFPDESSRPDKVEAASGPSATNMLLLGSDSRAAGVEDAEAGAGAPTDQRSDTMMWVHIPADRKNIYVMSILRDTWVDVPGHGESKINSAMAFGGIPLTVQTLENMFDTRLDNVAIIDFEGFKAMTDALGGVEVNVPVAFNTQQFSFPAGKQELTGEQALAFVRERKAFSDGDYQRVKNQQVFLKAILSRFLTPETLTNPETLSTLVDTVSPYVSVDATLDAGKVGALAVELRDVRAFDVTSFTLPTLGIGTSADGQSIVLRDDAAVAEIRDALKNDTLGSFLQQSGVAR
ncbi:LCP family protein required for cell wall assembly [Arthrobacter sp. V4I6]|uniref:LCP family protein n=1 Tax=unclassified Arthrobacter TaxID=235627 RepID=UPI0027867711|nr:MULTISPECIES: LCP family protein [unclassified Arthrobacter]MDQ0820470.1 LCP family protein required for cell wall assembly [Arthrobacter sp. V1I7]MDQ0854651.1 LCP family protein required for cell wall assembly [Arthrobacter sp. V4I6]